jgi:carbon monoxide dehydrogenase subunit G
MEMKGEQLVPASQQDVWNALNDPQMLKECIPGCEALERVADNEYMVLMVSRVGPVSAKFKGKLTLSEVNPPRSYSLSFEGQGGAAGFAKGGAQVQLSSQESFTKLSYEAKANVGGKLAQIGSRLIEAAAKKVADDFFRRFNEKVASLTHKPQESHGEAHPEPLPRDPDAPQISDTTLRFFAAGILVVTAVSLFELFG